MRLFTRQPQDEQLDPEILALFESESRMPEFDERTRMRARAAVAGRLIQDSPRRGGLLRRFALAGLGGGGLWASLAGAAAAHKAAAAAVGVTAVLGGSLVAGEASGVGPSVREALGISQPGAERQEQPVGVQGHEQDAGPPADSPATVDIERADETAPGNIVTHVRADGSFTMRAILMQVNGNTVTLEVAGASEHTLELAADALVRAPGPRDGAAAAILAGSALDDYIGHLVFAAGTCAAGEDLGHEHCEVTELLVQVHAGQQPPKPEDAVQPELPSQADGAGQPEGTGQGEQPAQRSGINAPSGADGAATDAPPVNTPAAAGQP